MSYQIIYDQQFIKVNDYQVLPLLCQGSSNSYELNNKKRTRDWSNTFAHNPTGLIIDNSDLIDNVIALSDNYKKNNPEYTDKSFGYYQGVATYKNSTHKTTFGMYLNIYAKGIKGAKTIEDLRRDDVKVTMYISKYSHEKILKANKEILSDITFKSTEHMIDSVNKWLEYYKGVTNIYIKTFGLD